MRFIYMGKSFELGEIALTPIVEQQQPLFDIFEFFPDLTPELYEENRSWLEPWAVDPATRKLILCVQSYLVRTPHQTILIDSCVGNDKPRPGLPFWHMMKGKSFLHGLAAAGVSPADIDFVMCTHLHVDHVGWNTRLENGRWVPTFPNARYIFSERELAYWTALHAKNPIACIADSVLRSSMPGRPISSKVTTPSTITSASSRHLATPRIISQWPSAAAATTRLLPAISSIRRSRHAIQKSPMGRTSTPNSLLRAAAPSSSVTATLAPSAARRTSPNLPPAAYPNGAKVSGARPSLLEFAA